jgi:hypothetical protein
MDNNTNEAIMPQEEGGFLSAEAAFMKAIEKLKGNSIKRDKVYVWRQRYKEGKLSHKKVMDILESAGFKLVVEEKWIALGKPSQSQNGHNSEGESPLEIINTQYPYKIE